MLITSSVFSSLLFSSRLVLLSLLALVRLFSSHPRLRLRRLDGQNQNAMAGTLRLRSVLNIIAVGRIRIFPAVVSENICKKSFLSFRMIPNLPPFH